MKNACEQAAEPLLFPPPPPPPPIYGVPVPFQDHPPTTYILLPVYPLRRRRRRGCSACCAALSSSSSLLTLVFFLALLASASFFLWPSDPDLKIARLRLDRIHVSSASIDVSLRLDLMVRNRDFFTLDYESIDVAVGYRDQRLGSVKSGGGHIRARGVSYVDAELRLNGIRVIDDIFYLIQDIASGSIPFDTVTEVQGRLHLFFFDVPIQGRFPCVVHVNPENQTVVHQDCYPEVLVI